MINKLKKLQQKIALDYYTMYGFTNSAYKNPEIFTKHGKDTKTIFAEFGIMSLAQKQIIDLVSYIEKLKIECIDEINGDYYENHEKQFDYLYESDDFEDDGIDRRNIYYNILLNIEEGTYDLTGPILNIVKNIAAKDLAMNSAFNSFFEHFPEVKTYTVNNGTAKEVDNYTVESKILSEAYELQNYFLDDYPKIIKQIKEIIEQKGNVGKIIELISN